ncbi:MAG: regulatory protein RecX [Spirochaetota bacterium]
MIIQNIEYTDRYIRITLDTGECIRVDNASVPSGLLRRGAVIDIEAYNHLKEESMLFECKEKALYYISIRSRTEHDIKKYLMKKGFDKTTISRVLQYLTERGLINDYEYAVHYIQSVREHKVIGNKMLEKKLFEKGVDKGIIKKAIRKTEDKEPDIERVYQLALKKYNQVKEKSNAKVKVVAFLQQRGFSWEVIKKVMKRFGDDYENMHDIQE